MNNKPYYRVFLSSNDQRYRDLWLKHTFGGGQFMQTLRDLNCIPFWMNGSHLKDVEQNRLLKSLIQDCDIYVLILADGDDPGGRNLFYLHLESLMAIEKGMPFFCFIERDSKFAFLRENDPDPEKKKLWQFKNFLNIKSELVGLQDVLSSLSSSFGLQMTQLLENNPPIGWRRADMLPARSQEDTDKMLRLEKRAEAAEARLKETEESLSLPPRELSDGEEIFDLRYTYTENFSSPHTKHAVDTPNEPAGNKSMDLDDERVILIAWDELFGHIGPCMIREASQKKIKKELIEMVKRRHRANEGDRKTAQGINPEADEEYSAEVRKILGDARLYEINEPYLATKVMAGKFLRYVMGLNKGNKERKPEAEITISDAVLNDIILQFWTLELIDVSPYKHSLIDCDTTYWTLTDKGKERLKKLRTKPSIRLQVPSSRANAGENPSSLGLKAFHPSNRPSKMKKPASGAKPHKSNTNRIPSSTRSK